MQGSLPSAMKLLLHGFVRGDVGKGDAIAAALVAKGEGDNVSRVAREYGLDRVTLHRQVRRFRDFMQDAVDKGVVSEDQLVAA